MIHRAQTYNPFHQTFQISFLAGFDLFGIFFDYLLNYYIISLTYIM